MKDIIFGMLIPVMIVTIVAIPTLLLYDPYSYTVKVKQAIDECEKSLPRDKYCTPIFKAEVTDQGQTILTTESIKMLEE